MLRIVYYLIIVLISVFMSCGGSKSDDELMINLNDIRLANEIKNGMLEQGGLITLAEILADDNNDSTAIPKAIDEYKTYIKSIDLSKISNKELKQDIANYITSDSSLLFYLFSGEALDSISVDLHFEERGKQAITFYQHLDSISETFYTQFTQDEIKNQTRVFQDAIEDSLYNQIKANDVKKAVTLLDSMSNKATTFDEYCSYQLEIAHICITHPDIYENEDPTDEVEGGYIFGLKIYEKLMDTCIYSTLLLECWEQWRVATQRDSYGMSNFSEIPNAMYNSRRKKVLDVIQNHIKSNPEDKLAINTFIDLASDPDIFRFTEGVIYGNDATILFYISFPEILDILNDE